MPQFDRPSVRMQDEELRSLVQYRIDPQRLVIRGGEGGLLGRGGYGTVRLGDLSDDTSTYTVAVKQLHLNESTDNLRLAYVRHPTPSVLTEVLSINTDRSCDSTSSLRSRTGANWIIRTYCHSSVFTSARTLTLLSL